MPGGCGQSLLAMHLGMHALPLGPAAQVHPSAEGQAPAASQSAWTVQLVGPPVEEPLSESMPKYPRALPKAM